ncbi:PP2C family protein-serine/threonine phosphatase [Actibacterium sp. XHP0104]|uniref:PP2C family protein-serine/threonine phosphatase n=1 Tax=Actibacterium sp. XHP0104 TaxID=2984335 RepID=UPI0021E94124|nr:protein phosphatase 2C domain-containing protein [Actibacterium sp. XHP0104]MCV2882960.1 protein phosphatase 2C domain-containing protein [Actibacterium sp. XHP0104]
MERSKIKLDAASAISMGQREYQEDALITDFTQGSDLGIAVLADGMGGHAAGDIASKIAVTEVFSELKLQSGDLDQFEIEAPDILRDAVLAANECIGGHSAVNAETRGMGSTLLALAFVQDRMFWASVGDSPLYCYSEGQLARLNADHSMAPQIDLMVSLGQMTEEEAREHPERNCLTSVLCGAQVARMDCPNAPMILVPGEVLIAASDGLQFLDDEEIAGILRRNHRKSAAEIAAALMAALDALGDPDQDNITLTVIKVLPVKEARRQASASSIPFLHQKSREAEFTPEPELAMAEPEPTPRQRPRSSLPWLFRRWKTQ